MSRPEPGHPAAPARSGTLALITLVALLAVPSTAAARQQAGGAHEAAHPPPATGGVTGSSPEARRATTRLLCLCGGCVNQTLHECTCGMAATERGQIEAAITSGKTAEQVIQAYVERYGPQVLSTPDRRGFNLVGWLVPFFAAVTGLLVLTFILRGWLRRTARAGAAGHGAPASGDPIDPAWRDRLAKELEEFKA